MEELFNSQTSFAKLGLSPDLLEGITKQGFEHPTHIQASLIPLALAGRDILGQAKTGTGKTAAFGLPILQLLDPKVPMSALILVPTRELAMQVAAELRKLAHFSECQIGLVYGGQRISTQADQLRKGPHIIVGTPGRVMDMHGRGYLPYDNIRFAVLDEVDRMLDIGFRDDIRKILGTLKQQHQTIFVSATISAEIEKLARSYMKNPEKLVITGDKSLTVAQVKQVYFSVEPWDKKKLLVHLLTHEEPALTLVFCRTKHTVDALADYLQKKKFDVHTIHGDMHQGRRNRVMTALRSGELSVLIASDLASRGLDVENITHVVNYDLPEDPEIYIHRIGRTARAGRDGIAWSFVTPEQGELLTAIEHLTNVEIPRASYEDFEPGPVPSEVLARRQLEVERAAERRLMHDRQVASAPTTSEAADAVRFPGGLVPTGLPERRLGGRVRTRRR